MKDPRDLYLKPPFEAPKLEFPGLEAKLTPKPDWGKESYQGSNKLKGRVAIVTGGDSGIGRAVAYAFASEGAKVAISYLPEEEGDARVVKEAVEEVGQKALMIPGDIQNEFHCQAIVKQTVKEFGQIDLVINNAAYQKAFESLSEITEVELDRTFRTNIYAMFFLVKAAWVYLKPGAVIINMASIQAFSPDPILMPYAATKGAIVNFTKSLAKEAIKRGIRVNAVAPGPIWTPLNPMAMPQEMVRNFGKQTPYKRPGQPVEVAKLFVFLASDDASYITGRVYGVTGGEEMVC